MFTLTFCFFLLRCGLGVCAWLAWVAWVSLQVATIPTQAFVILSSYAALSRPYELGKPYEFSYETFVILNEPSTNSVSSSPVGFKMEMRVEMTPVWQHPTHAHQQIWQLMVTPAKVFVKSHKANSSPEGFISKASRANSLPSSPPFFVHWEGGKIKGVFHPNEEDISMLNLKKGIASLLQYQTKNDHLSEIDSGGRCEVTYKLDNSSYVTKTKGHCTPVGTVLMFNHTNKVLGASLHSTSRTTFSISSEDSSLRRAESLESYTLRAEARKTTGALVTSRQVLEFKGRSKSGMKKTFSGQSSTHAMKAISSSLRQSLLLSNLGTTVLNKECIACKTLSGLTGSFRSSLSAANLATQASAIAFLRLVKKARESEQDALKSMLRDKTNSRILPQLIDIVAACQTVACHKAAMSVLNFSGKTELPERYLFTMALNTHPLEFVIGDLFHLMKRGVAGQHLQETLVLCIASMTNTFALQNGASAAAFVSEIRKYLEGRLEDCANLDCRLTFIRSLKNLRHKNSMKALLKFAFGKEKKAAVYAMRAIQTMPAEFIDKKTYKKIDRIFFELDAPHDSSVRAMAAEILLRRRPLESTLKDILSLLKVQRNKELNTLLLGQLKDLAEKNNSINEVLRNLLQDKTLGNYHVMGQNGLSSAFSRPLGSSTGVNASFNNMLEVSGGLLKRSTVDVFVEGEEDNMRLLSIGLFAGGLSMFGSSEETTTAANGAAEAEEPEPANAGIEISLLDSQLRPFVFFNSQSELMGHVWSGTGSERTTALQGSILLQDHSDILFMQNGLHIDASLTGVVSYDFAGQVQISLWNRNSHSLVEVGAATVIQGQLRVDNNFVQTLVEFNTGLEVQLDFVSDLDFYEDIVMCLQMVQPQFQVIDNVRKLERIPGTNYVLRKYKRRKSFVPGKTYVMNRKNTELCNKMFTK